MQVGAQVHLFVPLLAPEAFDIVGGYSSDADPLKRLFHVVQLVRFDYRLDLLHPKSPRDSWGLVIPSA